MFSSLMKNNMADMNRGPLGLYLHFPFCVRKCRYCDFLSFPSDEAGREAYLQRLKKEIIVRGEKYQDYSIAVSYTHLDVYKRQINANLVVGERLPYPSSLGNYSCLLYTSKQNVTDNVH